MATLPPVQRVPAAPTARILIVDDEAGVRHTLRRALSRLGECVAVATAQEALDHLAVGDRFDLVVTDYRMPEISGLELLQEIRQHAPDTRRILISGHADAQTASAAVRHGIDHLLLKPVDLTELRTCVADSLERRRAEMATLRRQEELEARLAVRERDRKSWILKGTHALVAAVEARDPYTAGHSARVGAYASELARVVGGIDLPRFALAGDLHDIGKIAVPDYVLNKPGRLTEEEMVLIRSHPARGVQILEPLFDDVLVLSVTMHHHERWDGRGYPDGLAGEDIPLAARVLALADTLDAITSSRAYRPAQAWDAAAKEIRACAGRQFDPAVVEAFDVVELAVREIHRDFQCPGSATGD